MTKETNLMSNKITELTTQRNKILMDAHAILQRGFSVKGARTEYDKLVAESDDIQETLDMLNRLERSMPSLPVVSAPVTAPAVIKSERQETTERKSALNAAYRSFFRHGYQPNRPEQRDVLTTSDGAAIIPQEFEPAFVSAQKWYGPIATLVKQIKQDSGRARKVSIFDDTTATMTYLPESNTSSGVEADPTLSSVIPGTDTLITTIKYSLQELEDAESLDAFIRDAAGLRVSRAVEYALTLGKDNGSNTALPSSPVGGFLANVSTGVTQSALSAGITYAELSALAASVDHAYYVNGAFMASPSVFNLLVSQVSSTGKPLYKFDPATGLLVVAGKLLYVNNAMPAYNTASSPVVLFGDYSRAYAYLNGGGMKIRVLTERYAETLEILAVIYQRIGASAILPGAVKALVTAAA
jgi:HK97 family phage major capsid protein